MKTCSKCGKQKDITMFAKTRVLNGVQAHRAECKDCINSRYHKLYSPKLKVLDKGVDDIPDLEGEIWKDVNGFEGRYKISNLGRLKSFVCRNYPYKPTLLNKLNSGNGYHNFTLTKDGKAFPKSVHRIIAEAFIPNPNEHPFINHIDADKKNNDISNLEWVTPSENIRHAYRMGLLKNLKGELCANHKLTDKEFNEIFYSNMEPKALAVAYAITEKYVKAIKSGRYFRGHPKKEYVPIIRNSFPLEIKYQISLSPGSLRKVAKEFGTQSASVFRLKKLQMLVNTF
jgi:hypothetical protein